MTLRRPGKQAETPEERRSRYRAEFAEYLATLTPTQRKRRFSSYDRDLGEKANRRSVEDLRHVSWYASQVRDGGVEEFMDSTFAAEERRQGAKAIAHQYSTIVTEHLPGWWRHAHPWLDVEAIRATRNAMHEYHSIISLDLFEELCAIPDEVDSMDLEILELDD
jgi:hypothetical protein